MLAQYFKNSYLVAILISKNQKIYKFIVKELIFILIIRVISFYYFKKYVIIVISRI